MFHIAIKNIPKVRTTIGRIFKVLADGGMCRIEQTVELGKRHNAIRVKGRWVKNTMKIDICVKGRDTK